MPDYSFIANQQQPSAFNTVGNMLNFANQAQQLKQGGVNLARSQATFDADVAQRKAESSSAQTAASVAQQTAGPTVSAAQSHARQADAEANLAQYRLTGTEAQIGRDATTALVNDPSVVAGDVKGIIPALQHQKQLMIDQGLDPVKAEVQYAHAVSQATADPKGFRQTLLNTMATGLGAQGQATAMQPSGPAVSSGQQTAVINTNALGGPTGQPIPGTVVQQQLPPSTPTFNATTNTPGYLGPQPAGTVPPQSGPALGQPQVADAVVGDWKNVSDAAKTASQDIGVLQTIKQHAHGAVTGVEADKRSYLAGLASLVGMDAGTMAKTDTDLLAKNSNMLALAGGDTNLAKTLAESANPNTHMTEAAIWRAANQVIGQRQLALERQRFLQPYVGDPNAYNQKVTEFNQVADPRILQLPTMTPAEKLEMKKAMSPQEQAGFSAKIRAMQQMGILR